MVIDAIDEVPFGPDRNEIIQTIQDIASLELGFLRLLLFSRPESDIRACLHGSSTWRLVEMPQDAMHDDIGNYIDNEISRDPRLRALPTKTKVQIRGRLVGHESGMFRWAALQLEALKKTRVLAPRSIDKVLKNLPQDLDTTYTRLLSSIDEEYDEEVRNALQWLTLAFRPLYVEELIDACVVHADRPFQEGHRLRSLDLLELLSHLVSVEPAIDLVSEDLPRRVHCVTLAHFSVKEYLIKISTVSPETSHQHIASGCINYLRRKNLPTTKVENYPLLHYAWDYWALHAVAEEAGPCDNHKQAALGLFEISCYSQQQTATSSSQIIAPIEMTAMQAAPQLGPGEDFGGDRYRSPSNLAIADRLQVPSHLQRAQMEVQTQQKYSPPDGYSGPTSSQMGMVKPPSDQRQNWRPMYMTTAQQMAQPPSGYSGPSVSNPSSPHNAAGAVPSQHQRSLQLQIQAQRQAQTQAQMQVRQAQMQAQMQMTAAQGFMPPDEYHGPVSHTSLPLRTLHQSQSMKRKAAQVMYEQPHAAKRTVLDRPIQTHEQAQILSLQSPPSVDAGLPTFLMSGIAKSSLELPALKIPYFYEESDRSIIKVPEAYHHLPIAMGHIRLLKLHPGSDPFTEIRCSIIHVPLQAAPDFEAISFTWKGTMSAPIRVNGLTKRIPGSLKAILYALRAMQGSSHRHLWVDACCIEHDNPDEWQGQVARMSEVYEAAHEVAIWIGEASEIDKRAIWLLRELSHLVLTRTISSEPDLSKLRDLLISFDGTDPFESIRSLFDRSWWTRTWVVQDFLLSTRPTLIYGDMTIGFEILQSIFQAEDLAREYLSSSIFFGDTFSDATLFSSPAWRRVRDLTLVRVRMISEPGWKPSLPEALYLTSDRRVERVIDRFWAVAKIVSDDFHGQLPQTCEEFTRYILRSYKTLDSFSYITFPDHRHVTSISPSWSSDYKTLEPSGLVPLVKGIFHGPAAVDIFSAAGSTTPVFRADKSRYLTLQGTSVDCIAKATITSAATSSWEMECSAEEARGFCVGRRIFTTDKLRGCLMPLDAAVGDVIVVLLGGKVPYVLRPVDEERYLLVGEW